MQEPETGDAGDVGRQFLEAVEGAEDAGDGVGGGGDRRGVAGRVGVFDRVGDGGGHDVCTKGGYG